MLYLRLSQNRAFLINEYWLLVPLVLAIDIGIIVHVKRNRKISESEYLKKCKLLKIYHLATKNLIGALQVRGRR